MSGMNTSRIAQAVRDIERCETALKWLLENGEVIAGAARTDAASVVVGVNYASACTGAKEAQEKLTAHARFCLPDIVKHAIADCQNTIEISRDIIREESARD